VPPVSEPSQSVALAPHSPFHLFLQRLPLLTVFELSPYANLTISDRPTVDQNILDPPTTRSKTTLYPPSSLPPVKPGPFTVIFSLEFSSVHRLIPPGHTQQAGVFFRVVCLLPPPLSHFPCGFLNSTFITILPGPLQRILTFPSATRAPHLLSRPNVSQNFGLPLTGYRRYKPFFFSCLGSSSTCCHPSRQPLAVVTGAPKTVCPLRTYTPPPPPTPTFSSLCLRWAPYLFSAQSVTSPISLPCAKPLLPPLTPRTPKDSASPTIYTARFRLRSLGRFFFPC